MKPEKLIKISCNINACSTLAQSAKRDTGSLIVLRLAEAFSTQRAARRTPVFFARICRIPAGSCNSERRLNS